MKSLKKVKIAFLYWASWLLIFQIARVVFIVYNHHLSPSTSNSELLTSLWYGMRMDMSMASYFLIPVCLGLMLSSFFTFFAKPMIYKYYTRLLLIFVLILVICDLPAYEAWGYRLDSTPLRYLQSPAEAWASVSHLPLWLFLFAFVMVYFALNLYWNRVLSQFNTAQSFDPGWFQQAFVLLIFTALQIIPIRGGTQLAPLNQSGVYFSQNTFANNAALNVPWVFMYSASFGENGTENPYVHMDMRDAQRIRDSLFIEGSGQIQLLDTSIRNPNIIFITWESLTSKALGLKKNGVTVLPGLERLIHEGIFFSNVYASGDRTDKGIVAVLSGYPAQPIASIIKIPSKSGKLEVLPKYLSEKGYHNTFCYGGETEFANMKTYLLGAGFSTITDINTFNDKDKNSKWGAHDQVSMHSFLNKIKEIESPFFAHWLTLSSHEPFETPVPTAIQGNDDESLFLNSLHYTDSVIYAFVENCRKESWWKNTVLVIIADHGHRLPSTTDKEQDFRIPMMWLGGALLEKNKVIDKFMSQTDLPATLWGQVFRSKSPFPWSRNVLLSEIPGWAYFCFNNGFGYVEKGRGYIYDNTGQQIIQQRGETDSSFFKKGMTILQLTYADYLSK